MNRKSLVSGFHLGSSVKNSRKTFKGVFSRFVRGVGPTGDSKGGNSFGEHALW